MFGNLQFTKVIRNSGSLCELTDTWQKIYH
jgi:hypothetical protein